MLGYLSELNGDEATAQQFFEQAAEAGEDLRAIRPWQSL